MKTVVMVTTFMPLCVHVCVSMCVALGVLLKRAIKEVLGGYILYLGGVLTILCLHVYRRTGEVSGLHLLSQRTLGSILCTLKGWLKQSYVVLFTYSLGHGTNIFFVNDLWDLSS